MFVVFSSDLRLLVIFLGLSSLYFLALGGLILSFRRSRAVIKLEPLVSVDSDRIVLPEGVNATKASLTMFGFYSKGYHSKTRLEPTSSQMPTVDLRWPENSWGACVSDLGEGWFEGTCYSIDDGPFKDVILIPIIPTTSKDRLTVHGSVDAYQAVANISVDGPTITGQVQTVGGERPGSYGIRLRGRSKTRGNTLDVDLNNEDSMVLQTQPSRPVILMGHRHFINPRLIFLFLRPFGMYGSLFGGLGIGTFQVELVIHRHEVGRGNAFPSEPIAYS
jgi:hypothetical protein